MIYVDPLSVITFYRARRSARAVPPPEPPLADLVRLVSPEPPHEPEPHPDEPFAPVYDHKPLGAAEGTAYHAADPDYPDPLVFGAPDSVGEREPDVVIGWPVTFCACGAGQGAPGRCWNCGRPG